MPRRSSAPADGTLDVDGRAVAVTHLDKVLYPDAGFTKADAIAYVSAVAAAMLPHLRDRPVTLKRYPDGVAGPFFFEKQAPSHRPDWVRTTPVWSETRGADIAYPLVQDRATLVWLTNLAALELHAFLHRAPRLDRPDALVFDLDPGPPATVVECCRVGLKIERLFERLGLESFAKTSGSKGLQIYVPLDRRTTYKRSRPFAEAVAQQVQSELPDLVVVNMRRDLRPGKIFIDWSQNDEHKTTAAVYSLRAKARPTVSTPVKWTEVRACAKRGDPSKLAFETAAVLRRLDKHGDLFAPVLKLRQKLPA